MLIKIVEPLGIEERALELMIEPLMNRGHQVVKYENIPNSEEEMMERCQDAEVIIVANSTISDDVIKHSKHLKMISVAFTGIDHIGAFYLKERNIVVSNAAGYSNDSVAELVIALTLNILRNVCEANQVTRNGGTINGLVGNELKGKTVGVVGTGKIGLNTAILFKAFGCNLIGFDPYPSEQAKEMGIKYVTLEELFKSSDVVTLHLPLMETTRGIINRDLMEKMKPNSIFINCARGPIVDNNALSEMLNTDKIAAAGIDVYDMEPPIPSEYPLLSAKNTLFTPHVAYATGESMIKRAEITVENVIAFLEGKPQNVMIK